MFSAFVHIPLSAFVHIPLSAFGHIGLLGGDVLRREVATFCYVLGKLSPEQRAYALAAKEYDVQRVYW